MAEEISDLAFVKPCVICEKIPPREQLVYNINRGAIHILCLTKEVSNQDDVITAFTDQEFDESTEAPPEIKPVSTEGLSEYSDTLKVDEGENSSSGYANDTKEEKEEVKKEDKKDAMKKPYGKLGMYKDALNYDFDDDDDVKQSYEYDNEALGGYANDKSNTKIKSNTNAGYHNDVKSDDEDTPSPKPSKPNKGGYTNDNDSESDKDDKEVNLDQGSYMQQPMDDMLGLGSSPDTLRQRSVPKIKLGYADNRSNYNETSDYSEGEIISDSSDEEESGSFESLRNSAEAIQPAQSNIDPNYRDWNDEYQEILSLPEDNERNRIEKNMRLINIISEFKQAVERIGKVIIAESNKIPEAKTYKPLASKGIAGGQKYIVENLFFKLSIDNKGLYGADEFSRKVANIELLGLKGYINCQQQIPNLRTPLLARVDFMGYRLLAMCVLPIGSNTLIYGSDDGGRTVNTVDPVVNKMMEKAGRFLNLQPHKVSPERKIVWAAADVEVHRGNDGRYYVLDTARVFPPECPYREVTAIKLDPVDCTQHGLVATKVDVEQADLQEILGDSMQSESLSEGTLFYNEADDGIVNLLASGLAGRRIFGKAYLIYGLDARFLFYQLRPELVMQYKKALNPDAFTNFTRFDENYKAHNVAVLEATNHLRQVVINKLAHDLLNNSPYVDSARTLKEAMHKYGVNVRYLGLLRSLTPSPRLQTLMLFAMICRCVKNFLARKLRKFHDRHESVITKYLNILLGNSKASEFYWTHIIKVQIEAKFGQYGPSLMKEELMTTTDFRKDVSKYSLFHSICSAIGIKYKLSILKSIQNDPHFLNVDFPFSEDMIESIEPRASIATTVEVENPELRQSLEKVRHLVNEAMLSFNGKHYDDAHNMLQEAKQVLSVYQVVPAELAAKLLFIQGNIYLAKQNFDLAESSFGASLYAISKVAGAESIRDYRIKERNKEMSYPLSALLIINNLITTAELTLRSYNYRHWSYSFHCLWIASKCPLNKQARRMLFGVEVPKPLLSAVAHGSNYDFDYERKWFIVATPYAMPPETEHQFDYYHPISQAWINNLMKFEESSGVNLYIDWGNEEEMNKVNVAFMFGHIDIPSIVDPTQPIKVKYNLPEDVSNGRIVAATRSDTYWNFHNYRFLWEPALDNLQGEVEIPPEIWDQVPANDKFLIVGFYDKLTESWYFPPTYVLPLNHTHTMTLGFQEWRTNTCEEGLMNGSIGVVPIFPLASEIKARKLIERNNAMIAGISETGKAFTWVSQNSDLFGAKQPFNEGQLIEGLVGKDIVDIDVGRSWIDRHSAVEDTPTPPLISFFVALTKKGLLFTWGTGNEGVLGLGFSSFLENNPRVVRSLQNTVVVKVVCGRQFIIAISKTGHVFMWGKLGGRNIGSYPQLISISPEMANFAFKENELIGNPIVDVACGPEHAIMLSNRGSFYYFGNTYPDGGFMVNKKIVLPDTRIVQIASGAKHILLLSDTNKLYAFGSNTEGELGTFSDELPFPDLEEPFNQIREVKFNSTIFQVEPQFLKISAEYNYSVALTKDHELFVWGNGFPYPVSLKTSLQRYNIEVINFVTAGNMSILLPNYPYEENKMLEALKDEQLEGYVPTPRRNNATNAPQGGNNNNNMVPLDDYLELKQRLEKLEQIVAQLTKK